MLARHLTTWDAGHFVQVKVPVMHAQETRARLRGSPRLCTILCSLHDLAPGKGSYCAATLAEWPRETAADQQPLTEHLQHQTGTHSAPTKWL